MPREAIRGVEKGSQQQGWCWYVGKGLVEVECGGIWLRQATAESMYPQNLPADPGPAAGHQVWTLWQDGDSL